MTDNPDTGSDGQYSGSGLPGNIAQLPSADRRQALRVIEARLFAAAEPLTTSDLADSLGQEADVEALIDELKGLYAGRGVNLVAVGGGWMFRTADDLSYLMERHATVERRLSKAALETLATIAYHQPVTRAEIEEVRGVATSKGTLDQLMEIGWVRPRGRRRAPGRPVTYGTTTEFLSHFSLEAIRDLPGLSELKGSGLLSSNLPSDFKMPEPSDVAALMPDELPLEDDGGEIGDLFPPDSQIDDVEDEDEDDPGKAEA